MAEEPAGTGHVWHRAAAASPHRASCLHTDMHTRHDFTRNTCTFSQKVKKRAGYRQAQRSAQPLSLGAEFRKEALLLMKGLFFPGYPPDGCRHLAPHCPNTWLPQLGFFPLQQHLGLLRPHRWEELWGGLKFISPSWAVASFPQLGLRSAAAEVELSLEMQSCIWGRKAKMKWEIKVHAPVLWETLAASHIEEGSCPWWWCRASLNCVGQKNKGGLYSTLVFHKSFEQMFNSASPESLVGSGQLQRCYRGLCIYGAEKPISNYLRSR